MRLHASDAMASLLVLRGLRHQPDNAMIHHLQNQPVAALRFGIKLRNIALCVLTDVIDQTVKGEKTYRSGTGSSSGMGAVIGRQRRLLLSQ